MTETAPTIDLRALRHLKGYTLDQAAAVGGFDPTLLSKIERGKLGVSLRLAVGIHRLYGIAPEFWLTGKVYVAEVER